MKRQAPMRRRNRGGSKPSSCLTLPAPVFTKRSSAFSSRKAVSRSMMRMSARDSVDQRTRLAIAAGFVGRRRLAHLFPVGHGETKVGEDDFHGDGAVLFERIEADLNGGAV